MKHNLFNQESVDQTISRINNLKANSKAVWGKMDVAKMLAHCNVTYEMIYDKKHPRPNVVLKFILKKLVKNKVVTDKPYPKNGKTAPQFIIKEPRDFANEKSRLIQYIEKTYNLGENYFDGKESHSLGSLTIQEWNNMLYKHLNHHLNQFGV